MEKIKLVNKRTGVALDYDLYLGNTPQTIMVETDGVGKGYTSLADLAKDYEIVRTDDTKGEK